MSNTGRVICDYEMLSSSFFFLMPHTCLSLTSRDDGSILLEVITVMNEMNTQAGQAEKVWGEVLYRPGYRHWFDSIQFNGASVFVFSLFWCPQVAKGSMLLQVKLHKPRQQILICVLSMPAEQSLVVSVLCHFYRLSNNFISLSAF